MCFRTRRRFFIRKPFDAEELLRAVKTALSEATETTAHNI